MVAAEYFSDFKTYSLRQHSNVNRNDKSGLCKMICPPLYGSFQSWQVAWKLISIFSGLLACWSSPGGGIRWLNIGVGLTNLRNWRRPLFRGFYLCQINDLCYQVKLSPAAFHLLAIIVGYIGVLQMFGRNSNVDRTVRPNNRHSNHCGWWLCFVSYR